MNKLFYVFTIMLMLSAACQPTPTPSPTVPAPTAVALPTATATRAPTATVVPTAIPTVAIATATTVAPTATPTTRPPSTPTVAPTATPIPKPTAIPVTPDASGVALELFNRVNALRAASGLEPYRLSSRLSAAAQRHSQDMANSGNISHIGSDGSTAKQRVLDTGYGDWPVGENIYGGVATVDDAWGYWTTDPAHRDGLLSQQFRDVGIGVVKGKAGAFYYTMTFGTRATTEPVAPTVSVQTAVPSPTATPVSDVVLELFNRTNALRTANGLPPYRLSDQLNASAQRHSQDMVNSGNISHTGSDGSTARQRVLNTGYEALRVGENIYGGMASVDDAWEYWSQDPPHRANLLNTQYVDVGIAVVKGPRGTFITRWTWQCRARHRPWVSGARPGHPRRGFYR